MTAPARSPLVNAEPVEVAYLDGSRATVTLARLSIRQLYQFAEHVKGSRTPELVALCAGKPLDWIDTLTPESFAALAGQCVTANFPTAMTIAEKDPVMAMMIGPIVATGILSVAQMLPAIPPPTVGAPTPASSPAPAPSASAEATGNASST